MPNGKALPTRSTLPKDSKDTITSYQVYFALYQQLVGDNDQEHYSELFDPEFFDLIIVDDYAIIGLTRESPEIKAFAA